MGKLIGIGFIAALAWIGMAIHNEGLDGAFGGILSSEKEAEAASRYISTPQRVEERVKLSMKLDEERTKALLAE